LAHHPDPSTCTASSLYSIKLSALLDSLGLPWTISSPWLIPSPTVPVPSSPTVPATTNPVVPLPSSPGGLEPPLSGLGPAVSQILLVVEIPWLLPWLQIPLCHNGPSPFKMIASMKTTNSYHRWDIVDIVELSET